MSGSGSRDKGGEERAGRALGLRFVPESGAALWVSLKQEGTSCPPVTSQCHSGPAHTRLSLCVWPVGFAPALFVLNAACSILFLPS